MFASFASVFLSAILSALPFLLLGCVFSGAAQVYFRPEDLARLIPRQPVLAALAGSLLGLFLPTGDAGTLPLARRLAIKGAPPALVMAFLASAPSLNLVAAAASLAALGPGLLFWGRLGMTLVIGWSTGMIFSLEVGSAALFRFPAPSGQGPEPASLEPSPGDATARPAPSLDRAIQVSVDDFFHFGAFAVLGAALAALARLGLPQALLLSAGPGPLARCAALAGLGFVYSSSSMEIAFTGLGLARSVSAGPLLAFLVFAPVFDLKRLPVTFATLRARPALYLGLVSFAMTLAMSLAIAYLNP